MKNQVNIVPTRNEASLSGQIRAEDLALMKKIAASRGVTLKEQVSDMNNLWLTSFSITNGKLTPQDSKQQTLNFEPTKDGQPSIQPTKKATRRREIDWKKITGQFEFIGEIRLFHASDKQQKDQLQDGFRQNVDKHKKNFISASNKNAKLDLYVKYLGSSTSREINLKESKRLRAQVRKGTVQHVEGIIFKLLKKQ